MEPELMALALAGGPAAIIAGMILLFLRPVRAAFIDWIKSKTWTDGSDQLHKENADA